MVYKYIIISKIHFTWEKTCKRAYHICTAMPNLATMVCWRIRDRASLWPQRTKLKWSKWKKIAIKHLSFKYRIRKRLILLSESEKVLSDFFADQKKSDFSEKSIVCKNKTKLKMNLSCRQLTIRVIYWEHPCSKVKKTNQNRKKRSKVRFMEMQIMSEKNDSLLAPTPSGFYISWDNESWMKMDGPRGGNGQFNFRDRPLSSLWTSSFIPSLI